MNTRSPVIEVMDDEMADILRQKTDVERVRIGLRMWRTARVILRAAIRTEHPDWSELQITTEIARRISGGAG